MRHTIRVDAVLQDALGHPSFSALVTRPTGVLVRGRILEVIAATTHPTTGLDFSALHLIDFSCADEVVAKLLHDPQPGREHYIVLVGLTDAMCDAVHAVLERQRLAVAGCPRERPCARLLGWAPPDARHAFDQVYAMGPCTAAEMAETLAWPLDRSRAALAHLTRHRLARTDGDRHAPLPLL